MSDFAENLRKIRRERKLTQFELAEIIGISENQISLYERGVHKPTIVCLEWLCTALNVSSKDLLGF